MMRLEDLDPLARCPKAKICDYNPILDEEGVQVERCSYCHRKVHFNKDKDTGRIDNAKYKRVNIRKFVQPVGEMKGIFEYLYGNDPVKKYQRYRADKEKAERKKEELAQEAKDMARFLYRTGKESL